MSLTFEKVKKKYALNNSYFKNRHPEAPSDPFEVLEYYRQHKELPYDNGKVTDEWFYECFCEYQKRAGVQNDQFFTPEKTAKRMVEILKLYDAPRFDILDACCGFGQITKHLRDKDFYSISAFDNDPKMTEAAQILTEEKNIRIYEDDFTDSDYECKYPLIISNPPYTIKKLTLFFEWLSNTLYSNGTAVLLLPSGFLDKSRPAALVKALNHFKIVDREPANEKFKLTGTRTEIVVLGRL